MTVAVGGVNHCPAVIDVALVSGVAVRLCAVLLAWAPAARAMEQVTTTVPPPPGFEGKRSMDADDLRRKNERGYVTGLPLFNYDPNTGFGFGARAYYYWNGYRDDPLFAYTPYLHRVFVQGFASTNGLQFHWLDYQLTSIAHSPYRLRGQFLYVRNTDEHYFGLGARAMRPLSFPGSPMTYRRFSDYTRDLRRVQSDGTTYTRYNSYDLTQPTLLVSVERSLFRGLVRPMAGVGFGWRVLEDYTGKSVSATAPGGQPIDAPMARTRLRDDCDAGALVGCAGGWDNILRLGISFDTRDFEPDPNRGVFIDAALDVGTKALGSRYQWARFLIAPRVYLSPFAETDLVIALRGTLQLQSRGTPFFAMNVLPYTEDTRNGLGGVRTLRGFKQNRFVGPVMALGNAEVRWTFVKFTAWKQKIALIAAPLFDLGSTSDRLSDLHLSDWRWDAGAALRISWNLATIVTIDYGKSAEDAGVYVNFNHIF